MGYKKIITYILKSENGASLKASNFVCEGEAGEKFGQVREVVEIMVYQKRRKHGGLNTFKTYIKE